MKLRLEAGPDELREKTPDLLKSLQKALADVAPEVAEVLEKALPAKEPELKYPVLRDLQKQTTAEYERTMKKMVQAIGKVLDRGPGVAKSELPGLVYVIDPADLSKGWLCGVCGAVSPGDRCEHVLEAERNLAKALYIGPRGGRWADPQHTIPWDPEKHGRQVGLALGPRAEPPPAVKPAKPPEKKVSDVIENDPVLTDEQRKKPKSDALKAIEKRIDAGAAKNPEEWELPPGARIDDPWEAPAPKPTNKWEHPDYGSGTGAAPWQQEEDWKPDFHKYDIILINSSAGKDSQAMLTTIVEHADKVGYPRDQIVVVHADLGRVEWEGSKTLAQQQAEQYGLRFEVVKREKNDLVDHIDERYGDLSQREIDSAILLEAGVRTFGELAAAAESRVLSLIGDGAGVSDKSGEVRAGKLISAAKQKIERERKKLAKKIAKAEAAVRKAKDKLRLADTDPKRQRGEKGVARAQAELDTLRDQGDPETWPLDFGKAIPWPSMDSRFCTSDHKRDVIKKLMTKLGEEHRVSGKKGPVKILNSLGIRAQESLGRAKMDNFTREVEGKNQVTDKWYPLHRWPEKKVWETIERSKVPYHRAYKLGMRRLSCCFCVLASPEDLMVAAVHNPSLFKTYLELEEKVGAPFKAELSLASIAGEIKKRREAGYELNDLAQWVKKSLELELDDDLVKAELAEGDVEPTLVNLLLEAALARLSRFGQSIQTVTLEWKSRGLCVHLDTAVDSHHVEHLPYPQAYNASMVAATFAQRHGLTFEEHNAPPPWDSLEEPLQRGSMSEGDFLEFLGWEPLDEEMGEALWDALEKAGGDVRPHKYIRRVRYTDSKGRARYRYYYRESAAARAAQAGEEVRLGERLVRVTEVRDNGDITIEEVSGPEGRKIHVSERISANAWAETLAEHYGEKFYQHAEKRARQAIAAVLRHVPARLLADLRGDTDEARLGDLKQRVPEVYERLQAAFQRAGVNAFQAKQILARSLERKGWEPEARALVVGAVLTPEGAKLVRRHRQLMDAAENLAGGDQVESKHAAVAINLVQTNVAETAKRAEAELVRLQKALQAAWDRPGDLEKQAAVLAEAMASKAVQKLQALATAFPGLRDRAVSVARDTMLEVPSVAPSPPKQEGAEAAVYVAGEGGRPKALKARYKLVEASELVPSHDPVKFQANEKYPPKVQERAYHRDKAEQMKVIRNAKTMLPSFVVNTSPDAVNGPPLVTEEGIVLGGNSRTMSMQRVYADEELAAKAEELKAYLAAHAHEVGLNPGDVENMKQPVLVRVVEVEDKSTENLQLLVRQMNESFTQAMDPRTMQVALGRRLSEDALQMLAGGMEEDETLNTFLGTGRASGFINMLYRAGIIDDRNSNQYTVRNTKKLNSDGKVLVARILAGRVLNDADLLSETKPSLVESVAGAVPYMVQATGYGAGYDLGESVRVALDAYNRLQAQVEAGALKTLDSKTSDREIQTILANQFNNMFGEKHPILDDPRAQAMLELFIRRPGPKQMRTVFKEYAKLAAQNPEGQTLLGVTEKLLPDQVFRLSIQAAIDKEAKAEAKQHEEGEGTTEMFAQSQDAELEYEVELPASFVETFWKSLEWDALEKARTHKYIRRVPYMKDGKRRYRYYYKVTGGAGLAHGVEIAVGAKFKVGKTEDEKQPAGHLTIMAVEGDMVQVQHDETGDVHLFNKKALQLMLHKEHGEEIREKHEQLVSELRATRVYGTEKQRAAVEKQLQQFQGLFNKVLYAGERMPPRMTTPKPPKWYAETQAIEDSAILLMNRHYTWLRDLEEKAQAQEGALPGRTYITVTEIPVEIQQSAKALIEAIKVRYGEDPNKALDKIVRTYAGSGFYGLNTLQRIADGDVSVIYPSKDHPVGEPFPAYELRYKLNFMPDLERAITIERAKVDLKIDAKEELRGDVALLVSEMRLKARLSYFNDGKGTRQGLATLQDMLGQIRTQRGIEAFRTLMERMTDTKIPAHRAVCSARAILNYDFQDLLKKASKLATELHDMGLAELNTTVNRPVPKLMDAIQTDVATVREAAEKAKEIGRRIEVKTTKPGGAQRLEDVETARLVVDHRFSQLGPNSAVSKVFQEEFGITVHLEDFVFDSYFEVPYVTDKDYNEVDIERGLRAYSEEDKKEFQKKLKSLSKDKREKVKRFIARYDAHFGLHGSTVNDKGETVISDWASTGEKAAFREFQMVADMSYEARVEALQGLWNALSDMKTLLGEDFNLSNLPLVISERQVSCGASAHYAGGEHSEGFTKETLAKIDPTEVFQKHQPHIALGLGLEKSLAHEIAHYLDNRISLRVAGVGEKLHRAMRNALDELVGREVKDDYYEVIGQLEDHQAAMHTALSAVVWARGDSKYLSSSMINVMKLQESEAAKADPKAKRMADSVLEQLRKIPTGEETYQMFQGLKELGILTRFRAKDDFDKEGGSVAMLMQEMAGIPKEKMRSYWENGTEIVARLFEQHLYYQGIEKKILNPTLTHMMYEDTEADGRYTYLTPEEYQKLKPKIVALLGQIKDNMSKAADPAEPLVNDFTKPIYERDDLAYSRVKQVLIGKGYVESDFEEGGPFWGWSVNQLIDFARDKRVD